jgi:hypothetical protein
MYFAVGSQLVRQSAGEGDKANGWRCIQISRVGFSWEIFESRRLRHAVSYSAWRLGRRIGWIQCLARRCSLQEGEKIRTKTAVSLHGRRNLAEKGNFPLNPRNPRDAGTTGLSSICAAGLRLNCSIRASRRELSG